MEGPDVKLRIKFKGKEGAYPVFLGCSLEAVAESLELHHKGKKVVVVTDDTVLEHHGKRISKALAPASPVTIGIPSGEESKSREIKMMVEDRMLDEALGRDTVMVAIGGGVVGDLAGFVASTYNRGISLVHVPTTLVAMVDSSVGGKTGIDTRHGKNLIGSFWQPEALFINLEFLDTLPEKELACGLTESIKMAVCMDAELFGFMEKNAKKIKLREKDTLLEVIRRSIVLKAGVVEDDTFEAGRRQVLNFGHTIGHAIESATGYGLRHGEAVSIGMSVEAGIAAKLGELERKDLERLVRVLEKFGLPTSILENVKEKDVMEAMMHDKKAKGKRPRFVVLQGLGKVKEERGQYSFEIPQSLLKEALER